VLGDLKETLTKGAELLATFGAPDVVIVDPPRAGMHEDVVRRVVGLSPGRIVYVSCNPATQARDLKLMGDQYAIREVQPVDMFPHTFHVESVVLLSR
jgi:23S rRNA (uracil1939-C5)-methyltransferase